MQLTKDQWIQKAKALFFDCTFCVDSRGIKNEIDELMAEGGGYDPMIESSKTPLKWFAKRQFPAKGDCNHPDMQFTPGGDHWCPKCHWTDDDGMETS